MKFSFANAGASHRKIPPPAVTDKISTSEPDPAYPELTYVISYGKSPCRLRFDISLWFKGEKTGRTQLCLPSEWAGQKRFYEAMNLVRPRAPQVKISDGPEPHSRVVSHPPGKAVHIRYQLFQNWNGPVIDAAQCYWPILQEEYFHFIGTSFFVHPDWNAEQPLRITLQWKNLPDAWRLSNSFGTDQVVQTFTRSISELRHAIYVGGDFRNKKIYIKGKPLHVAMRGRWNFSDSSFYNLIKKVVEIERDFWNDNDFPYFLVTLIPTAQQCGNYAGTGLTDSFATFVSTDKLIDKHLKHLIAHELFHTWNGVKIKRKEPEELIYWFTEGFTEYYTRLLLLRANLVTMEEYIEDYNAKLFEYYSSPFRQLRNVVILKNYWQDENIRRLPYLRGDIMAHNWNALIRLSSRGRYSLDNVMTDLFKAAQRKGVALSPGVIRKMVWPYLNRSNGDEIKKYINSGVPISPHQAALGPCIKYKLAEITNFDLGFSIQNSGTQRYVEGVRSDSNAYRVGLRNGQLILKSKIFHGHPLQMVEIRISDSTGEREVAFYPAGKKLRIPQYTLKGRLSGELLHDCQRWFAAVAT